MRPAIETASFGLPRGRGVTGVYQMFGRFLLVVGAAVLLPAAGPPADPARQFGARPSVLDIALSPKGEKIAYLAPGAGQGTVLYTVDLAGGGQPRRALVADGQPERLSGCNWVSEVRLVCSIYMVTTNTDVAAGEPIGATRLIAVDADGGNLKLLSRPTRPDDLYVSFGGGDIVDWLPGEDGSVLMGRDYVPEIQPGRRTNDTREGYGVDKIDTATLKVRLVESARKDAVRYISDGRGKVRIVMTRPVAGSGYATGRYNFLYRTGDSRDWKTLGSYDAIKDEGIYPTAIDPDLDVAYVYKRHQGRDALFSVALDGTMQEKLVFAHPQVDVSGTVRIGRNQRVVGARYSTDKSEAVYFDRDLEKLRLALSKALPGLPLIHFADSSVDEKKLLLWAGSDVDPGRYYLFDKDRQQLGELMLGRPDLENAALAPMKHVTYRAADGTMVPAYLTLPVGGATKGLPAIVMPHGGPSARDEWGFDWMVQFFASRGYAVLQPNYRGSSGYGAEWFRENGFKSWKTAIGDVNDAGRWLVGEGIADPDKLGIFGWSYGGYAALQSGVLDPDLYKAVVAVAPVTDLPGLVGDSRNYLSHRVIRSFIGTGPHVAEGSPARNAARIKAPVLMFHGDHDLNVASDQARTMRDKLKAAGKSVELVEYKGLDHQLEDSAVRRELLSRSDAFLRAAMKID